MHRADGWRAVLEPVVARYRAIGKRLYFRGDAAFANPEIYEFLEAERMGYTIRLPANRVLQDRIGHLLKRPVGRPPHEVRQPCCLILSRSRVPSPFSASASSPWALSAAARSHPSHADQHLVTWLTPRLSVKSHNTQYGKPG